MAPTNQGGVPACRRIGRPELISSVPAKIFSFAKVQFGLGQTVLWQEAWQVQEHGSLFSVGFFYDFCDLVTGFWARVVVDRDPSAAYGVRGCNGASEMQHHWSQCGMPWLHHSDGWSRRALCQVYSLEINRC